MIPNVKISHTILEFGKEIINQLPKGYSKNDLDAAMKVILSVWNSVTVDSWNGNKENEMVLLKAIEVAPKQVQLEFKQLIARKKKFFSNDLRAVGKHWIREDNGQLIFGCDARANVADLPANTKLH